MTFTFTVFNDVPIVPLSCEQLSLPALKKLVLHSDINVNFGFLLDDLAATNLYELDLAGPVYEAEPDGWTHECRLRLNNWRTVWRWCLPWRNRFGRTYVWLGCPTRNVTRRRTIPNIKCLTVKGSSAQFLSLRALVHMVRSRLNFLRMLGKAWKGGGCMHSLDSPFASWANCRRYGLQRNVRRIPFESDHQVLRGKYGLHTHNQSSSTIQC